jgi:hypothetical protein
MDHIGVFLGEQGRHIRINMGLTGHFGDLSSAVLILIANGDKLRVGYFLQSIDMPPGDPPTTHECYPH